MIYNMIYPVSKVCHFMNRGGHRSYCKSDLVYIDIAHIVLDWNGNSPVTTVALDPAHLTGPNASGEYFYDLEIEDSRRLS